MKDFNEFIVKHGIKLVLLILLISYTKSCSINSDVDKLRDEVEQINLKTDSLSTIIIDKDAMIKLIETTPAWKTLRIEEISDKERISINALEQKDK